jgi:stage II sporulation protein D
MRGTRTILLCALCCAVAFPATSSAMVRSADVAHKAGAGKQRWVVKGAGFGHGVGMSQYGAYGYAKHGFTYDAILAHYYTGTTLGTTAPQTVRVLLQSNMPSVSFSGAGSACGTALQPGTTYVAKPGGGGVVLQTKAGGQVADCGPLLSAAGAPTITVAGKGTYRGLLEVRKAGISGVNAINAVDIEEYVRGVISKESPSSWPAEALKSQAVAARSYALASTVKGAGFDLYDDTRSQVYGGAGAETAKTDAAVAATALQVVLYQGRLAQTFFFSTSGGHTENNENSSLGFGQPAVPYLRGVEDPYEADAGSSYAHWKRKYTVARLSAALRSIGLKGRLRKVVVKQRGASPRIVRAKLVGSGGGKTVTGPQLRDALDLPDTWAFFKKK